MNKKLVVSALVLGFSFAPISAFADSLTTVQGGTPQYSCPDGQTLQGDKCAVPATPDTTQNVPAEKYSALKTQQTVSGHCVAPTIQQVNDIFGITPLNTLVVVDQYPSLCTYGANYPSWNEPGHDYFTYRRYDYQSGFSAVPSGLQDVYTCPNGGTLDGTDCITKASYVKTIPGTPATTVPATISGSNGGSLVASVSGFFSPVLDFLKGKLLPAIGVLVLLGIAVRLTISAVQRFSHYGIDVGNRHYGGFGDEAEYTVDEDGTRHY